MKRNKYIVYVIVMIMIVSIGVSYSYFVGSNDMNKKEIKITSKDISIVLTDNMIITDTTITPGWSTSKTFTVKNNSDEVFNYNIIIKDLINTFVTEGFLQYKITSTNGYNMTEYVDVPKSSSPTDTILAYDIDINPGVLQEYTIEFIYRDSDTVDQSEDMGKVFSGTLAIVEGTIDPNKFYSVTLELENGNVVDTNPKTSLKNGSVTFEVEVNTGYELSGKVECNGTASGSIDGNIVTISSIKEDQTCTVSTSKKTYTLSIGTNNANMGTVSPSSFVIEHGESATITLSPKTGYKYSSNNCGGTVSGNTMTISNVTAAKTCTVTYEPNKIYVQFHMNGGTWAGSTNTALGTSGEYITLNGSKTISTYTYGQTNFDLANYNNKSYINIIRTGYQAVSGEEWKKTDGTTIGHAEKIDASKLCDASKGDCTVVLYVNWEILKYAVKVSSNNTSYGTVTPTSTTVNHGSNATITLSPKTGYKYSSNNCGGTVSGNTMTIKSVTAAKTCTVTFAELKYTVTFTGTNVQFCAHPGYSSCGYSVSQTVSPGSTVLFRTLGSSPGFKSWSFSGGCPGVKYWWEEDEESVVTGNVIFYFESVSSDVNCSLTVVWR